MSKLANEHVQQKTWAAPSRNGFKYMHESGPDQSLALSTGEI